MFTTGSKWFLGLGLFSLVLAAAYGWTTGGTGIGPLTAGYYGGVGDHLGYTLLVSVGVLALFLGLVLVATRDADPGALAELVGSDEPPAAVPPAHLAYWPVLGAVGAALVVLGLVISNVLFVAACILLIGVLVEWMVLAWSDRATGDPEVNRAVRARIMGPYEVPLVGVLLAGGTVAAMSRVFLTASKEGAVWVATAIGIVVFLIGAAIAARPRMSRNVLAGVLSLCAVGVIAAGVVSAARGERTIEPHHAEEGEHATDGEGGTGDDHATDEEPGGHEGEPDEGEGRPRPLVPEGTERSATTTTEAQG